LGESRRRKEGNEKEDRVITRAFWESGFVFLGNQYVVKIELKEQFFFFLKNKKGNWSTSFLVLPVTEHGIKLSLNP
jgi:hypothetical protein